MNKSEKLEPASLLQRLTPEAAGLKSPPGCNLAALHKLGSDLQARASNLVLFAGPSGTGKTMAAQALAHQLGSEVFRIDARRVVSKYIGETEKNLSAIFARAATSNPILFFDEADSLFGKRAEVKDSHDKYANMEVDCILQQAKAYPGIVILACNEPATIDAAATRLEFH